MNISLNWIRDFVDLPKLSSADIAWKVTVHTAEVEGVIDEAKKFENIFVGKIMSISAHPNADKLRLVDVDLGEKIRKLVCGGSNLAVGMKVAVATPGAVVQWHGGETVTLELAKIRGEESYGMICAGSEIGLTDMQKSQSSDDHAILDLSHLKAKEGVPLAEALGLSDTLLEVDNKSLTHRPDLWSHYGFAREMAAIFGKPLKKLDPLLKIKPVAGKENLSIKIEDNKMCPRFSAAILTGIKIEESPQWLKARLQAAGMNPHNNVVDVTNYVMLELGQPMHAYDRQVVGKDGFIVRAAKKGEVLVTLDETEQKLHDEDPLVCSLAGSPLGLAGIKGGLQSGISNDTTEIILESAAFDPIIVRKSSVRHALRTDASQRFEKSLDPAMTEVAIKRAINLLQELCPTAKLVSEITTVGTWKPKKIEITANPDVINSKIGKKIATKEMVSILKALEFDVKTVGKNLKIIVPSHRATRDVNIEEDIVEEVARIHGYDQIEPVLPSQPMQLPVENEERLYKHLTRSIFALGLGFTEVVNYSFYSKDRFEKCGLTEQGHVKILNYLSADQTHMRRTLVPNLLANIAANERTFEKIQIFELGHTYDDEPGAYMPREEKHLAAMVAMDGEPFYAIKGALESYLKSFGVNSVQVHESKYPAPCAHPKKCMDIVVRGKTIGQVFTLHPGTLAAYDIRKNVAAFELRFSPLVQNGRAEKRFTPLPKFPSMSFDVSVLVSKKSKVADLEKAIRSADSDKLIESVTLFDIYEGKNIPDDKKSLSYSIEIRHSERTLTEKEYQTLQDATFLAIEKFGGTIRGR
ncbi:MAG: phenylalanine--tRNA ligase subunit beta [Patescibacteria group bacterium]